MESGKPYAGEDDYGSIPTKEELRREAKRLKDEEKREKKRKEEEAKRLKEEKKKEDKKRSDEKKLEKEREKLEKESKKLEEKKEKLKEKSKASGVEIGEPEEGAGGNVFLPPSYDPVYHSPPPYNPNDNQSYYPVLEYPSAPSSSALGNTYMSARPYTSSMVRVFGINFEKFPSIYNVLNRFDRDRMSGTVDIMAFIDGLVSATIGGGEPAMRAVLGLLGGRKFAEEFGNILGYNPQPIIDELKRRIGDLQLQSKLHAQQLHSHSMGGGRPSSSPYVPSAGDEPFLIPHRSIDTTYVGEKQPPSQPHYDPSGAQQSHRSPARTLVEELLKKSGLGPITPGSDLEKAVDGYDGAPAPQRSTTQLTVNIAAFTQLLNPHKKKSIGDIVGSSDFKIEFMKILGCNEGMAESCIGAIKNASMEKSPRLVTAFFIENCMSGKAIEVAARYDAWTGYESRTNPEFFKKFVDELERVMTRSDREILRKTLTNGRSQQTFNGAVRVDFKKDETSRQALDRLKKMGNAMYRG